MTEWFLGIDGGGTQTRAALTDRGGRVVGTGVSGASNLAAVVPSEALGAALTAADTALGAAGSSRAEVVSICAGMAGFSFAGRRELFRAGLQAAFPGAGITVEPDHAVALAGATGGGPGVIVIAGTGSAAYGESADGQSHRTGGYGYLIDDSGSGYGVGRAALAAVLQAADGTGPGTTLTARIGAALTAAAPAEIIAGVYGGRVSRTEIASLSRLVALAASEDGDPVAEGILRRAGGSLARLTAGVTERLFTDGTAFPVVQIGGLWDAGAALTGVFVRSLRRFAPSAALATAKHPPVEGAAHLARRRYGGGQKTFSGS